MNASEKKQIYDFLKTVARSFPEFNPGQFPETPVFKDDKVQNISETETRGIEVSEKNSAKAASLSTLGKIAGMISSCSNCALCKTRTNTVPGTGVPSPLVLVIGEGPGYEEDRQGIPFVGPAGQLLDRMLASIQLSRGTNTYITNIVKCRPPQNRTPYPEEAQACDVFLQAQIAVLKPKAILCAGTVAAKNLLKTQSGVTKLRGKIYEYARIPVAVTYHPSALLRDSSLKQSAWEDLKMFRQKLLQIEPDYVSKAQNP